MEVFYEVLNSIKQNKVRCLLAGFGVAWGIFILIILLGTGKGFQNGILQLFSSFAKNSIWIYGGQVSESDLNKTIEGKQVLFDIDDIRIVKDRFSTIESISPEVNYNGNSFTSYKQNTAYPQIKGVLSDYFNVKIIKTEDGRLLNFLDNKEYRRVALIGKQVADGLFPTENPLGKSINLAGTYFTIIGIIEKGSIFTQNEQNAIYIPYNSFLECFNQGWEFNTFVLTFTKDKNATDLELSIKSLLGRSKGFDVNDKKAIFILNFENQVKVFDKLFTGIDIFLWFIGLCLLLSGIVGISSIMFVVVKERTSEIGIRKAIGATPRSIIGSMLTESIIIASMAGLVGLVLGIIFIELINWIIVSFFKENNFLFTNAKINLPVILFLLFMLILSGIMAGFLPARKTAGIMPVDSIKQ